MVDVTVGASAVPGANADVFDGVAGEAITINQSVYLDQTVNPPTIKKADADALATAAALGIALNTAPSGGHVRVQRRGRLAMSGATFTVGTAYFVSTTAGGIAPEADLASGDFPCYLGIGYTATSIDLAPHCPGIAKA